MNNMSDNELIAEFMGVSVAFHGPVLYHSDEDGFIDFKGGAEPYWPDKDWNELMPVVEKINSLNHTVHIYPTRARFYKTNTDFIESIHPGYSLIQVVYCGVVEFIKWWNENGK